MKRLFYLLLFLPVTLCSQGIFPLTESDLTGALVTRTENYSLETIFGYQSSGADLLVEFGFNSLLVQEIICKNEKFKMEVYQMKSPEGAFGMYSLSLVNCALRDTLNPYDCATKYQYQAAYGPLYISVTSESGSLFAVNYYYQIAGTFMQRNPQKNMTLPEPFDLPRLKEYRKNLVFINGPIGLQNSLFPWQDLFLAVNFAMYAIILPDPKADIYFARITFPTPGDLTRFLGYAGLLKLNMPINNCTTPDGIYHEYKPVDGQTIYFLQRQEPYPIDAIINTMH